MLKETLFILKQKKDFSVLLVDDEIMILKLMQRMMERICDNVVIANDGLEAWNIYQNHSFSIIVTDLNMPNMNGVELIKKIKAINPNQLIIVITAFSQEIEIEEAKKYGANVILEKPFSLESFLDAIKNMSI